MTANNGSEESTIYDELPFEQNYTYYEEYARTAYFLDGYIYYVDGIALLCVSVFGIVGSITSTIVLLQPRIRDFFSNFLTALSLFDCSFLLLAIPYIGLPAVSYW